MDKQPKLCIDCKHYRDQRNDTDVYTYSNLMRYCAFGMIEKVSLIDGKIEKGGDATDCEIERYSVGKMHCGKEGKHWEPKEGK